MHDNSRNSNPEKPFAGVCLLLGLLLAPFSAHAVGDSLIEAIMRSDFIFDKSISNVPFFPLGYVQVKHNDELTLEDDCLDTRSCDFSFTSFSQALGLPAWVGKKNMLILAETLESDRLEFDNESFSLNSLGLMAAWISQPSPEWQIGLFAFAYEGFGEEHNVSSVGGQIIGGGGRYRHEPGFHSYWGLVRLDDRSSDPLIYPYIGFDWFIGKTLGVSALVPWPAISYSPDPDIVYKFGATISGSDWFFDDSGELAAGQLGMVDFGFIYEKRLAGLFWLEAGVGYSGFSRLSISSDSDVDFDSNLERSPFFRVAINLRLD